jgi:methyltransferase (TIGR00027 family)
VFDRIPSITAASVAMFRSLASLPGAPFDTANDSSLRVLAPRPLRAALDGLGRFTARVPATHAAFRALSGGLYDHIALRTRAIDVALLAELARGTKQLVICGAGLDARAFRLAELSETVVFEVDHPATQRFKRARARRTKETSERLRFVSVDFARDSLDEALTAAGHDASRPTVWIWEGVTMYLAHSVTRATLAVIAKRSAPSSLALVTYTLPELINTPELFLPAIDAAFRLLGEPLSGRLSHEDVARLADEVGLRVERDTGERDWQRAHLRAEPFPVVIEERLVALRR